jgi:ABC-type multidrug transport system fused ATPase/permease subunit
MVLAMSEGVKGIRVTKTFGAEAQELERFRGETARAISRSDLPARQPFAPRCRHHRSTSRSCC